MPALYRRKQCSTAPVFYRRTSFARFSCSVCYLWYKVWGMVRIPKGEHCDYYDCANSRIYYGIRKGVLPNGIYDYAAPLQLILPRTESDRLGEIAQCVCTNQIGSTNPDMFDLRVLQKQFQSAYILRFRCFPTPSMKMICPSGARIFREADVELWNKAKEVGIYKIYPFV